MKFIDSARLAAKSADAADFDLGHGLSVRIAVLEQDIFRVSFQRHGAWAVPHTWSIAPGQKEVAFAGRARESSDGFSRPSFSLKEEAGTVTLESARVRVRVELQPFRLQWFLKIDGKWCASLQDRQPNAYAFAGDAWYHYSKREEETKYFGLGEKTGGLQRNEKKYEMRNVDAMDYSPQDSDPLYKHIPFYLAKNGAANYGIFYDNMAQAFFDFGRERENYYGFFTSYQANGGDLDYYVIHDESLAAVSKRYLWMTGKTFFPPKSSLRYSGSTMGYTEAENAQDRIGNFLSNCELHKIPVGSFQLSSGYCMHGKHRWVFEWNKERFPDFAKLAAQAKEQGVEFSANIKPVIFTSHPKYEELDKQKLLLRNAEGSEKSYFWDGYGSHLDFTLPKAREWWKAGIKRALFAEGIHSTWNDNNEYHIQDPTVMAAGFPKPISVPLIRPVLSLLMCQASYEAHMEADPNGRPWLISRGGGPGLHRYCQTWTGDNRTSWESLEWNIFAGLSLSISGVINWGIDVGGFSGPRPDPELLVRWIQQGIFYPRFTIHSWNTDNTVTEPWMYPEVLPIVQSWMQLRDALLPYLYTEFQKGCAENEPVVKPLWWGFEQDADAWLGQNEFLFGGHFLVCPVTTPGQTKHSIYLPASENGWNDFFTGEWFSGGQSLQWPISLEKIPVFVRSGSLIPLAGGKTIQWKAYLPPEGCKGSLRLYDDDGVSRNFEKAAYFLLEGSFESAGHELRIQLGKSGTAAAAFDKLHFTVAGAPQTKIIVNGQAVSSSQDCLPLLTP